MKTKYFKISTHPAAVLLLLLVLFSCTSENEQKSSITIYENTEQMVAAAKELVSEIIVHDFKNTYTREDIFIIDVRTLEEHLSGAVPGAVNIPRGMLEFRINTDEIWQASGRKAPQKTDPIFVYCSTGGRGALSAKALMQLGYRNVKSIQGGWNAWHEKYPDIIE
jgi:rhodanese-related sulfurtransferase